MYRALVKSPIRDRRRRFSQPSRRGATAVEFAITAPVFFLFLLAAFEFGWLNVIRHTADNAAYEAARTVVVPGATAAEATTKAQNLLDIVGARGATITITPPVITNETEEVRVAIDVPLNSNGLIAPRFTSKTVLHSESTLKTERAE
jgi:Flp pilus assembly protein TadG